MTVDEEEALLQQALRGSEADVGRLVDYLELHVRRTAFHLLGQNGHVASRYEANDLVQATLELLFRDGWRVLQKWDPERKVLLRTYVNVVSVRTMRAQLNRRLEALDPSQELLELPSEHPDQVHEARSSVRMLLGELSNRLSAASQRVFEILFIEDRDVDEAARELSISVLAVRSHKKRIRQEARCILAELAPEAEQVNG